MKRRTPWRCVRISVDDGRLRGVRWMVAAEGELNYCWLWWSKMKNEMQVTAPRRCKDGRCRRRRAQN